MTVSPNNLIIQQLYTKCHLIIKKSDTLRLLLLNNCKYTIPTCTNSDNGGLYESDSLLYIIFVTNHTKYVYESFNVQPFNYIVKSEKKSFENKLSSVIALLFNHMRQNQTIVLEDNRYGCVSVSFRDIKYIESKQHYCIFHIWHNKTEKSSYRIRKNISDLEQDLEYYNFVRIHKKYIVNLSYLISIDKNNRVVNFKDGTGLNMGPLYKQRTEEKFYNYLRKN